MHPQREVVALVEAVLGGRVARIERDTLGASNAVYFVSLAAGPECVVRISPPERRDLLAQEVWAYRQSRALGVPVPEILAVETSPRDFPAPYLLMRRLPGVPAYRAGLTTAEKGAVLEELGHYLSLIHRIHLPGFGDLAARGTAFAGRYASWWEYLQAEYARRAAALPEDVLPREWAVAIRDRLERNRASFALGSASLVHGDYQLKNVLVQGARVSGIVDFENLVAGDPVWDFRALHFWSGQKDADLRVLRRGYGRKEPCGDDFMERLQLYELLLALEVLWWEHHFRDAAGIAAVQARLRRIEDALDRR